MVAERLGLDMDDAFRTLRDHARRHNLRLADVAGEVISDTLATSALDLPSTRPRKVDPS